MKLKTIVIGSGPSGISVTSALLGNGYHVTMLDVGKKLEENILYIKNKLKLIDPTKWSNEFASFKTMDFSKDSNLSPKRKFGSVFPYYIDKEIFTGSSNYRFYGSEAYGGLSNVWGCALLEPILSELQDWPNLVTEGIKNSNIHVKELINSVTSSDYYNEINDLKISNAALTLLKNNINNKISNINLFKTPLAINKNCKNCNMCMYGCVYDYTYSSNQTIENSFFNNINFLYLNNHKVLSVEEINGKVNVISLNNGKEQLFIVDKVFIAAGMLATLKILWNSNIPIPNKLLASDSSYGIIPSLFFKNFKENEHHGLSHLSIDFFDKPFDKFSFHGQLYFNNPAVNEGLFAIVKKLHLSFLKPFVNILSKYLVIGQVYLNSVHSNKISLEKIDNQKINISVKNSDTKYLKYASSIYKKRMKEIGLFPIIFLSKYYPQGASKFGGALPHADIHEIHNTDLIGRPYGCKNIHVVDSTVLPSLPARNHSFLIMCNAYRIGIDACKV